MSFIQITNLVEIGFDYAGLVVLIVGGVYAIIKFLIAIFAPGKRRVTSDANGGSSDRTAYRALREGLGKSILLGLELLVAADIIRSVTANPNFSAVIILGLIVVVRTFLSWSLEVEIEGMWPWQRASTRPPAERHADV